MRARWYVWLMGGTSALLVATTLMSRLVVPALAARRSRAQRPSAVRRAIRRVWIRRPAEPLGGYWQAGGATRAAAKRGKRA